MRKYKIAISVIGIIVFVSLAIGFTLIGSPVSQTAIRYDETRYNDFQQLKYRIESYTQTNNQLPRSLQDLNYTGMNITDPVTKKPYTYSIVDASRYQLCTEFSTSAEDFKKYSNANYYETPINHTIGYSCITYIVPSSVNRPQ
jgi:hypothetical protein